MFQTLNKITGGVLSASFPSIKKSILLEEITKIKDNISMRTLPAFEDAVSVLGSKPFKAQTVSKINAMFIRSMQSTAHGYNNQDNILVGIKNVLAGTDKYLNALNVQANKIFSKEEPTQSLKLRQGYIVILVNNIIFANKYAKQLLNYIYSEEMCAVSKSNEYKLVKAHDFEPAEFDRFIASIRVLKLNSDNINRAIDAIGEFAGGDEESLNALVATQQPSNIDPMRLGYITDFSPFYILGLWEAEIRAWFVRSTEDEIELLTRRRIRLEQLYEGKNDAMADKEIDAIQRRIDDGLADMDDYRKRYKL